MPEGFTLPHLLKLSLQSNRLTAVPRLEGCPVLRELYLSHNGIDSIAGVGGLVNLRVLDVSNNRIAAIEGLEELKDLEDLWANDNAIDSMENVVTGLAGPSASLHTVNLQGNPVATSEAYKATLLHTLPNLRELDFRTVAR